MTLENIVQRTDPELIKIFNITGNTKGAKIKRYIQEKATGTNAEQITSEIRAEYVYHHYKWQGGELDPYELLSWPNEGKLQLPAPLRDKGQKRSLSIKAAIDIAFQYPDRINRTDEALEKLTQNVVENPGAGGSTRLDTAIYFLSHDKLDNEKHKKTREQIIEMFREKVFFHHYRHTDGQLDPYELLSWPYDEESKRGKQLKLPAGLRNKGLWKNKEPGIEAAIDIALQYPHRIDTSDEVLEELIENVVQEEDKGGAKLENAIYFLDNLESYNKTKDKITRDLYIKTLRYKGFIDDKHIRSEYVRSHPVVNGERKQLIIHKPFRQYVPGNKRHLNAHDKLMMAYDLAIKEGFKCKSVLATEYQLGQMHEAYGLDGVKAWYHFNLHINRDEFSDQSKNWIAEISEEEEGVLD